MDRLQVVKKDEVNEGKSVSGHTPIFGYNVLLPFYESKMDMQGIEPWILNNYSP